MKDPDKQEDNGLTLKQRNAIPKLLTPGTYTDRAKHAGVSPRTLRRWLQDYRFRGRLQEAGEEAMKLAASELGIVSHDAVAVLYDALHDSEVNVRIRVAQSLIKMGQSAHYGERLEQKVSHVEDAIELRDQTRSNFA